MARRVLITADAVGGVWTYALDLAGGLAAGGLRPLLAVLGPPPSADQRAAATAIRGLRLVEAHTALDWTAQKSSEVRAAGATVAALARDEGVDLIHLNSPALAAETSFVQPVVAACHSCVASWWAAVRGTPLPPDLAWRAQLTGRGYAAADTLIAPSRAFARATAETYSIPEPILVHNGRRMASDAACESISEEVFVLAAGRLWDEAKGLAILDAAASHLSCPVRAAGATEGPNGAQIALRHVQALGRLDDAELTRQFAMRPIFCAPALYEPFGLAVLEAAQAGCALVLSDIPSFRELWAEAAVFVPRRDEAALAEILAALVGDPVRRTVLGAAARRRAESYTVEAMVAGTLAVYEALLGPEAPARLTRVLAGDTR